MAKKNNAKTKEDYGFLFQGFERIIDWLYRHTLYTLLRNSLKMHHNRSFADNYVLFATVISCFFPIIMLKLYVATFLRYVIFIVTLYRVYEITIYAIYSYFTHKFSKNDKRYERIASARRKLFLLLFNIIEMINFFIIVGVFISLLNNTKYWTSSYFEAFKVSFYCFLTQNSDIMVQKSTLLENVAFFEILFGLFFIIVCISQILNGFSNLHTLEDEKK